MAGLACRRTAALTAPAAAEAKAKADTQQEFNDCALCNDFTPGCDAIMNDLYQYKTHYTIRHKCNSL